MIGVRRRIYRDAAGWWAEFRLTRSAAPYPRCVVGPFLTRALCRSGADPDADDRLRLRVRTWLERRLRRMGEFERAGLLGLLEAQGRAIAARRAEILAMYEADEARQAQDAGRTWFTMPGSGFSPLLPVAHAPGASLDERIRTNTEQVNPGPTVGPGAGTPAAREDD